MATSLQQHVLDEKRARRFRIRTMFLALLMFGGVALLVYRAVQLQVVQHDELTAMARKQYDRRATIPGQRGRILDRAGRELAASVDVDSIAIDPTLLKTKEELAKEEATARERAKEQGKPYRPQNAHVVRERDEAAKRLAPLMGVSVLEMKKTLDTRKRFVWLKRQATTEEAAAFRATNVGGLAIQKVSKRFYPQGELAAHVLGYSDTDGHGIEGLEKAYDDLLKGRKDQVAVLRDRKGRTAMMDGTVSSDALAGATLTLTLDSTIQHLAERALEKTVTEFKAKAGMAVVLDPHTGEILALANWPTFNPNAPQKSDMASRRNRAVADQMEQGSTLKPITVAAALEEKLVKPETVFDGEKGRMFFGRRSIGDTHPHDTMTVTEIIKYSSNIGVAKIAQMLGRDTFHSYQKSFGYSQKPGTEMPGEATGSVPYPKAEITLANQSFGQGISASILQTAVAYGALANGGVMMKPHIISKIVDAEGKLLLEQKPEEARRVVSAKTARQVIDMMEEVVKPGGTGTRAYMDDYAVAAKSGTAQKPENGRYSPDKRIASFAGIIPADDPKLVIAITVDEPTTNVYGGVVSAPAFKEIARGALVQLGVQPRKPPEGAAKPAAEGPVRSDRLATASRARLAGAFSMALNSADDGSDEDSDDGDGFVDDEGVIRNQTPKAGMVKVPSLYGLTARAATRVVLEAGLIPRFTGYGLVVEQKPLAGQGLPKESEVELRLK